MAGALVVTAPSSVRAGQPFDVGFSGFDSGEDVVLTVVAPDGGATFVTTLDSSLNDDGTGTFEGVAAFGVLGIAKIRIDCDGDTQSTTVQVLSA